MKNYFLLFLKGIGMGAANVIPGVSGGTIAFITNIYEDLIHSLKSFDLVAIQYLLKIKIKSFAEHVNLTFLIVLFSGIILSIISIGKLLSFLFDQYPVLVWSFFFGLIIASVYYVGKTISNWNGPTILSMITGTLIALAITYMNPASSDDSILYLIICGIVAMASMLLPGLSGSFVLILMGNYQLIFLEAVPDLNIRILAPVVFGSIIGFVILSRIISFLLEKFKNQTIGLLTGFILGSLLIIWPWKDEIYLTSQSGEAILRKGEMIVEGYKWNFPDVYSGQTWFAISFMIIGILAVVFIEGVIKTKEVK